MINRLLSWAGRRYSWAFRFNTWRSRKAIRMAAEDMMIFGTGCTRRDSGGVVTRIHPKDIQLPVGKEVKHE